MEHHDTGLEHEAESVRMFFLFLNHSCPILRARELCSGCVLLSQQK